MGRRKIYAAGAVLALIAFLAVPAAVFAKPGYFTFPGERSAQLFLKGTHGFRITVARIGHRVELTASNGKTAAIYVVHPRRASTDPIEASFPGVGRVFVRFKAVGSPERSPSACGGRASIKQDGVFRGVIRFKGEQGFTQVIEHRARGYVYKSFKETCKGGHGHENPSAGSSYALIERAKTPAGRILFAAVRTTQGSPFGNSSHYFASLTKERHGMVSIKVAGADGDPGAFEVGGDPNRPTSADLAPPAPFSGTASFATSPNGPAEWTGTLAVDLPGVEGMQLSGPPFKPELCLGKHCVGRPAH